MNWQGLTYVYRLTDTMSEDGRVYYVGKHTNKSSDLDLGIRYFSSSKIVRKLWGANPCRFKFKIIKICSPKAAFELESKYHRKVDACNNPKFYNKSNQSEAWDGVEPGELYVIDRKTCEWIKILKSDFDPALHGHTLAGDWISAFDTVEQKNARIRKDQFDGIRYVGVRKGCKQKRIECPICHEFFSDSNYNRHLKAHEMTMMLVTNGFDTVRVSSKEYFATYKDLGYNIAKHYAYINGKKYHTRAIGRILRGADVCKFKPKN